jgi:hypothetical protein
MKRVMTLVFAFLLASSLTLFAQTAGSDNSNAQGDKAATKADKKADKAEKKEAKAAAKGKSLSLTGWVKTEDGKPVFVNDKDKASWTIANPDVVSGHDGHHVKVKAKLNESDHSINVESLKMLGKRKQTAEEKDKEKKG